MLSDDIEKNMRFAKMWNYGGVNMPDNTPVTDAHTYKVRNRRKQAWEDVKKEQALCY